MAHTRNSHTHMHTSPCCLLHSAVGEERITLQPKALKDQPVKELIQVGRKSLTEAFAHSKMYTSVLPAVVLS